MPEFPLIFKAPSLGDGFKSIGLVGIEYDLKIKNFKGRGHSIAVKGENEGPKFLFTDDSMTNGFIRLCTDKELALEVNMRNYEKRAGLSLWFTTGHPEWACKWCLNKEDMTISAFNAGNKTDLKIGVNGGKIVLVHKSDTDNVCTFVTDDKAFLERTKRLLEEEAKIKIEREKQLKEILTPETLASFKRDGFVLLKKLVSKELTFLARQEVNRELGSSQHSVDQFKAKIFPDNPAIIDSFNKTILPDLMQQFLGSDQRITLSNCQIALRFPGDNCFPPGSTRATPEHVKNVSKGWHIDGCPNNFIKGLTDHYGTVHNFNCLIGIVLKDIDEPLSGELVVHPGSHLALAEYFKRDKNLENLKKNGILPTDKTDELFKNQPYHCVANEGDVILSNYMTAHFVAPNTSADIRYALYFRVKGQVFLQNQKKDHCPESMLDPWCHWPIIKTII